MASKSKIKMATTLSMLFTFMCFFLSVSCDNQKVRYDNHKIVRISSPNDELRQLILDTADVYDQTWSSMEVRLTPEQFNLYKALNIDMTVLVEDVQKTMEEVDEREDNINSEVKNSTWFSKYHTYDEIKNWFKQLAAGETRYSSFVTSIGRSHEGRDIFAFKFGTPGKPAFYFQSLQHAREWVSGTTLQYIVYHFLKVDRRYLDKYEFIVVPIVNPDGYVYTWVKDRLWRKNRKNNGNGSYGVDLNRNWNSHWGGSGSSSNPSSDIYRGPSVASEPEVKAVSKYFLQFKNIQGALDFHAYSQLLLRPYGWKTGNAEHESVLFACAEGMRKAILGVHGKQFKNIHSIELYVTTGTAGDWFYDDEVKGAFGKRIYAYTPELRPTSSVPGFQLPPSEIIPSGEEFVPAIRSFVDYIILNPIRT